MTRHRSEIVIEELLARHLGSLVFGMGLITFLLYMAVAGYSFLAYDDSFFVTENAYVRQGLTWDGVGWSGSAMLGFYHPLTWLSLMLDTTLFGINPGAFHLTNLWLHIANAVLLFYFLKRATGEAGKSLVVACLFAWHPINVETVAWIAERKGLLATLFALLALIAYVRYAEKPSRTRLAVVALAMLLSLLSKSMAVILPVLFLALDYWPLKRFSLPELPDQKTTGRTIWRHAAKLIVEKVPLFILSGVFVILTVQAEANLGAVYNLEQFSIGDRALNCVSVIPLYLEHLLIPNGFAAYYPIRIWSAAELVLFVTAVALLVWLVVRSLRTRKPIAAGIFWFLVCLAPVLGIIKIGTHAMADRYAYLAQIGLFAALVWTISGWPWMTMRRRLLLFCIASAVLMFSTHRQLPCWKDDLALASNGERVTGKNAVVCFGLGVGYEVNGEREKSLRCFREVLEHYFDYAGTHYNIARACVLTGRPRLALVYLAQVERQSRYDPRYHSLLAQVLCAAPDSRIRNAKKAVEHASIACDLSLNRNPQYLDTLAAAYAEAGDFAQAKAVATRAMQLAVSPEVRTAIGSRIRLYCDGKPFRGVLLHDASVRRR